LNSDKLKNLHGDENTGGNKGCKKWREKYIIESS
jgi:hypothetical protein